MVRYKDSLLPYGSSESKGTLCRNLQRSLFVLFCEIFGVQGAGGVEYSNDHNAHIGKNGGPHAGHANRAQHKAGELDGQCKHDVLVHDAQRAQGRNPAQDLQQKKSVTKYT